MIALLLVCTASACTDMNPYFDATRSHHRPDGFVNSSGQKAASRSFGDFLRWTWERWRDDRPPAPSEHVDGYGGFPVRRPDVAWLQANRSQTAVTWVGHATVLVQTAGVNVLTDPQFSQRASPVQWAGPKRKVPLPLTLAELPHIDLVVISHNHYDHLDRDSVVALSRQAGGPPLFAVPLGLGRWMREQGVEDVRELDWWQQFGLPGAPDIAVTFVPAHHWSGRGISDRNRTLWGGWVVKSPSFSFHFAGDTGYSADFIEIARRLGGVDLALIPVGAYEPRWFMSEQHVNPAEAVRIHQDLRAKKSIGIHWATFELTDEPLDAPLGALPAARAQAGLAEDEFVLLEHGQTLKFEK